MAGVEHGFRITNADTNGAGAYYPNHRSALGENREAVEAQIREEIANGRYQVVQERPTITSALGALIKTTGKVRLLHDASRPHGRALNDFATNAKFSYQTLYHATSSLQKGFYMAKLDLSSAYRSVKLHQADQHMAGLEWTFDGTHRVYLHDLRLPFGARLSAGIFNTLTQAVRRIMRREGFHNITVYLDDFLVWGPDRASCLRALNRLMTLVRDLGFAINYTKLVAPTTCLTFLGIEIDTVRYVLSLPADKAADLRAELEGVLGRRSVTRKVLQSLAGRLNWAAQVIHGGRPHIRRIIDRMNTLKSQGHRTRITRGILLDVKWWLDFLAVFNGSAPIIDHRQYTPVQIDACGSGAGGFYNGAWYHLRWPDWSGTEHLHINMKEVLALEPAARLWGHLWRDRQVTVYSDNTSAVSIINKGTTKDPRVMHSLRNVFWLSAIYNFRLRALYYPGSRNTLADACSRLSDVGGVGRLQRALCQLPPAPPGSDVTLHAYSLGL